MAAVAIAAGRDWGLGNRVGACALAPECLYPMEVEAVAWLGPRRWWKWFWFGYCHALHERWPEG